MYAFPQNFIIQHNQQYVIELDANLSPRDLFRVSKCSYGNSIKVGRLFIRRLIL